MGRFAPALREVARELDLPPPVKAAVLLEMAADLEAAFHHHRGLGAAEEEAERMAREAVLGSSEVVRRLVRLHRQSWSGWSERIGQGLGGGADLWLLGLAVAPMFVLAGVVTVRALAVSGSALAWPLLALALAVGALVAVEAGRILGGGRGAGRQLPRLLALSAVVPALGLLAAALEVHSVAGAFSGGVPDPALQVSLVERASQAGALLLGGLMVGLSGALSWFILLNRDSVRVQREADSILGGPDPALTELRTPGVIPLTRRRRA